MSYYNDEDKLTFDRAEQLVERYIRQHAERRMRVTCKDVASKFDVEQSHHNLYRINDALGQRLETTRESGSKTTQYDLSNHE